MQGAAPATERAGGTLGRTESPRLPVSARLVGSPVAEATLDHPVTLPPQPTPQEAEEPPRQTTDLYRVSVAQLRGVGWTVQQQRTEKSLLHGNPFLQLNTAILRTEATCLLTRNASRCEERRVLSCF